MKARSFVSTLRSLFASRANFIVHTADEENDDGE